MALPAAIALSGINHEHFQDLGHCYQQGACLLKSPSSISTSSVDTASSHESHESESWSNELSNEPFAKNLAPYFELLSTEKLNIKAVINYTERKAEATEASQDLKCTCSRDKSEDLFRKDGNIVYSNRNILNLASNIIWDATEFRSAELPSGVAAFFENRSQISRVLGDDKPFSIEHCCAEPDCLFVEYQYI